MRKTIAVILIVLSIIALVACNDEPAHEHTFSETWTSDENYHWHAATCEHAEQKADIAEHTWNEGEATTPATCTTDGVMTYTCTVCKATKTEVIAATGHSYEIGWSHDDTYHWHAATCEHTELFTDKAVHNWGVEGEITTPATHTQTGVRTYTCLNCNAKKTESIPADASAHEYSTAWTTDATYHWHQAICGHDVIGGSAEHTFGEVKVTKAATCDASGTGTQTCTVCGYVKNVTIPALGHDMADHVCTRCGLFEPFIGEAGGYVFYDCDADNAFGNLDGLISCDCGWRYLEAAPDYVRTTEGWLGFQFGYHRTSAEGENLFVNGTTVYDASNCTLTALGTGKENTRKLIEAMGDETYMAFDPSGDYAARICDLYSVEVNGVTYDDWFLPSSDEVYQIYKNLVCAGLGGFSKSQILWTSSENPDDAANAYSRRFTDGAQDGSKVRGTPYAVRPIRAYGAPEGEHVHTFSSAWTYSPSQHWHVANCGHVEEKSDVGSHTYDEGVVTVEPTCTTQGTKVFTCTVCGYSHSYPPMAALGHDLTHVDGVAATCTTPGTKTYNHCSRCGKDFNDLGLELTNLTIPAGHTWDEGTPDGAGNIDFECVKCHEKKKCPIPNYNIGDTGPAGGFIFYDCDADNDETNEGAGPDGLKSDICGWRYMEIWGDYLTNVEYTICYSTKDKSNVDNYVYNDKARDYCLDLDAFVTGEAIGDGKDNTEAYLEALYGGYLYTDIRRYATKINAANCPFYVAWESDAGGKTDWFIPSVGELVAAQKAGFTFKGASYGVYSSTHEATDAWYTLTMKGGVSSTSNSGPNSRWFMVRRFIVD